MNMNINKETNVTYLRELNSFHLTRILMKKQSIIYSLDSF